MTREEMKFLKIYIRIDILIPIHLHFVITHMYTEYIDSNEVVSAVM